MNKEELEKVEQLIEQKDSEQLKDLLAGLHPADIAELCNELDAEEAQAGKGKNLAGHSGRLPDTGHVGRAEAGKGGTGTGRYLS